MLTIFANIRINDETGLQHLKDSFFSFNTVSDNWLINVRGTLRTDAIDFLTKELGDKIVLFHLLDDSRGWIENALQMLPYARYDYLIIWNEDHLNIATQNELMSVAREMSENKADYLLCSWWVSGKARGAFDTLPLKKGGHVDTIRLTKNVWEDLLTKGYPYYILSLSGIYRKDFFEQLLLKDRVKMPLFFTKNLYRSMALLNHLGLHFLHRKYIHLVDKLLFHKLRYFPKETPFDLEKDPDRTDLLPYTIALAKTELFACIDDDLDTPGYQLIKRGKYPLSFSLQAGKINDGGNEILESNANYKISKIFLSKNEEYFCAYYEDTARIQQLLKETIFITRGKATIESRKIIGSISTNETVSVYPNIGYKIVALEDTNLIIVSPSFKNKRVHHVKPQELR